MLGFIKAIKYRLEKKKWDRKFMEIVSGPYTPKIPPVERKVVVPIVNQPVIATVQTIPDWFTIAVAPSPAEEIIISLLGLYRVSWYREVSFEIFKSSKNGYFRFDFFIPSHKLIIEYDGSKWHSSPDRIRVDEIKNDFCKNNGLEIVRFSSKEYYSLATHIDKLMLKNKIYRK